MNTGKYLLKTCTSCGQLTPCTMYCRLCGAVLGSVSAEIPKVECPSCKTIVADGTYCGHCGNKLK